MARRWKGELPRYRLHKQSGQAVVTLPLGGGKYRDYLLGLFDSEESKREYTLVINEWLAAGMLAPPTAVGGRCADLSVAEVCVRFCKHAGVIRPGSVRGRERVAVRHAGLLCRAEGSYQRSQEGVTRESVICPCSCSTS